jgi:hypothetical protein
MGSSWNLQPNASPGREHVVCVATWMMNVSCWSCQLVRDRSAA